MTTVIMVLRAEINTIDYYIKRLENKEINITKDNSLKIISEYKLKKHEFENAVSILQSHNEKC
jgi:hypothetical protein